MNFGLTLNLGSSQPIGAIVQAASAALTGLSSGAATSGVQLGYTASNLPDGVTVTGQSWRTATSGELATTSTYTPDASANDLENLFVRLTLSDASTVDSPAAVIRYSVDPTVSLSVSSATVTQGLVAGSTLATVTLGNTSGGATLSGADAALFEIVSGNLRNVAALDTLGSFDVTVNIENSRPATASAAFALTVEAAPTNATISGFTITDAGGGVGSANLTTDQDGTVYFWIGTGAAPGDAAIKAGTGADATASQAVTTDGGPYTGIAISGSVDGARDVYAVLENGNGFSNVENVAGVDFDTATPSISAISPADNATAVAIDSDIVITFSEAMDTSEGTVTLKLVGGATVEAFSVSAGTWSAGDTVLTLNPASDLANNTGHAVRFAGLQDANGNPLADVSDDTTYNFTTVAVSSLTNLFDTPSDWSIPTGPTMTGGELDFPSGISTFRDVFLSTANLAAVSPGTAQVTINPSAVVSGGRFRIFLQSYTGTTGDGDSTEYDTNTDGAVAAGVPIVIDFTIPSGRDGLRVFIQMVSGGEATFDNCTVEMI